MLTKNVLIFSILLMTVTIHGKTLNQLKKYPIIELTHPNGRKIKTYVAKGIKEQTLGLSGLMEKNLKNDHAMLFYYTKDGTHQFWMPDTYFNLDIFFLDKNYRVLSVERNVPHHPGMIEPPKIYRTKIHQARHVLEMKASSPLAKSLRPKQALKVTKGLSLLEKE